MPSPAIRSPTQPENAPKRLFGLIATLVIVLAVGIWSVLPRATSSPTRQPAAVAGATQAPLFDGSIGAVAPAPAPAGPRALAPPANSDPQAELDITPDVNAKVFLDGRYAGVASGGKVFRRTLSAGQPHTVRLTNEILGVHFSQSITMPPRGRKAMAVRLFP
jgi:hypothetical protein